MLTTVVLRQVHDRLCFDRTQIRFNSRMEASMRTLSLGEVCEYLDVATRWIRLNPSDSDYLYGYGDATQDLSDFATSDKVSNVGDVAAYIKIKMEQVKTIPDSPETDFKKYVQGRADALGVAYDELFLADDENRWMRSLPLALIRLARGTGLLKFDIAKV
jgi:hypothetical protein